MFIAQGFAATVQVTQLRCLFYDDFLFYFNSFLYENSLWLADSHKKKFGGRKNQTQDISNKYRDGTTDWANHMTTMAQILFNIMLPQVYCESPISSWPTITTLQYWASTTNDLKLISF